MRKTIRTLWLCPNCGSDQVQFKSWVDANNNSIVDDDHPMEDEDCYCKDCEEHQKLIVQDVPVKKKIIGFQVVDIDGVGDIHPLMEASFCIYSLSQAREMLEDAPGKNLFNEWKLLAIWSGDIEEPTMMFKGDPRG